MTLYHCGSHSEEEHNSSFTVVRCVPPLSPSWAPLCSSSLGGGSLLCLLSAFSPQGASVSWEVDGQELADTGASQSSVEQQKSGLYSSSSVLSLSEDSWQQGQLFSCRVHHHGHTQVQSLQRSQC
ncbi:hypothetical protein WMY93_032267 [Mugilogobius chulae]|uniref:Ig-like domain-containing protein n=1 Tax=Mugilogobius chulae TaxID=88201 RepID=A0AAW0MCG1_9GOBI